MKYYQVYFDGITIFMFSLFSWKGNMKVFNSRIYKNNNKIPRESRERRIKEK